MGTPVARIDRAPDGTIATEYQFHGLASSTLTAISSTGTINATFNYAPFGELIESNNAGGAGAGTAVHMRRFNDKEQDSLTTLSYYGARYYDRTLMGWTQVDPLYLRAPDLGKQSTPRRSNLAAFSLNNPVRYVDPDGTDSQNNGMSHWTDEFNSALSERVAAEGGDDETDSMAQRRWSKARAGYGWPVGGDTGTTTENCCDGIHGVCDERPGEPTTAQKKEALKTYLGGDNSDALMMSATIIGGYGLWRGLNWLIGEGMVSRSVVGGAVIAGETTGTITSGPSSRLLGIALEEAGEVRGVMQAAHHMIAGAARAAAPARDILARFGIGINDRLNGVWLPMNRSAPNLSGMAVHSYVHTIAYYTSVNDLMLACSNREEVETALGIIKSALQSGGYP